MSSKSSKDKNTKKIIKKDDNDDHENESDDKLASIMNISVFSAPKKKKEAPLIKNVKIDPNVDTKDEIIAKLIQKVEYLEQELTELRKYGDDTYYTFRDHHKDSAKIDDKIEEKVKDMIDMNN